MARFTYTARSHSFETIQGVIEADSPMEAVDLISRTGYFPISMKAEDLSLSADDILRLWKIPRKDLTLFTRQLSILLNSGVNIIQSLNLLAQQIPNKYLKIIIVDLKDNIRDGQSLAGSMARHPLLFSPLYIALIHSGEVSGNLEETLNSLSDFLQKEDELRESLLAALMYPLFVSVIGVITMIVLVGFVVPKLVTMFTDIGQALPLPTLFLISASHFIGTFWWLILAVTGAVIFGFVRYYHTKDGRMRIDKLQITTGLLKDIVLKSEISRILRTFALLLKSGIPMVNALEVGSGVANNTALKMELSDFKERIIKGASLSQCLRESKVFPDFVTNIIAVGEESGALEKALLTVAVEYERDAEKILKVLTRLLEPLIILVMGAVVGFIVLAMLLPIFQMNLMVN